MDTKRVILLGAGVSLRLDPDWLRPDPVCEDRPKGINPDCSTDHGERTNYKLKDQPFYRRGRNGKMGKW